MLIKIDRTVVHFKKVCAHYILNPKIFNFFLKNLIFKNINKIRKEYEPWDKTIENLYLHFSVVIVLFKNKISCDKSEKFNFRQFFSIDSLLHIKSNRVIDTANVSFT